MQSVIHELCSSSQKIITTSEPFTIGKNKRRKNFFYGIVSIWIFIILGFFINTSQAQTINFNITKADSCVPVNVNFTDLSSGGGGVISRIWDLGNGTFPTASSVGSNYLTAATYIIKLKVKFANGVTDSLIKPLVIYPLPTANFKASDTIGCSPLTVQFFDLSTTATGSITERFWDLDLTTSNQQNPAQTYAAIGQYKITLYVKNNWGCKSELATKNDYIQVISRPNVNFSFSPQSSCNDSLTVFFQNNSTNAPNPLWTFGDGGTSTAQNPSHYYSGPGSYSVKLFSVAAANCSDNFVRTVNIGKPNAIILATPDTVCQRTNVNFSGSTSPAGASCRWEFNGVNQNGCNITHQFTTPGPYDVLYIAYNSWGCADTVRKNIYVRPRPAPDFTIDTTRSCKIPFTIQATNLTQDRSLKFTWSFGDGSPTIISVDPPPHTYTQYGYFSITLTAEDIFTGCITTTTKSNIVRIEQPTVSLTTNQLSACQPPQPFTFIAYPNFNIEPPIKYTWTIGGTLFITTVPTISHTFLFSGTYTVLVVAESQNGCTASNQITVTLLDTCADGGGGGGGGGAAVLSTYYCDSCNKVTLRDSVSNSTVISWKLNNVFINGNINPLTYFFPSQSGNYPVRLTRVNNITGDTTHADTTVNIICLAPAFIISKKIACINDLISFTPVALDSSLVLVYRWTVNGNTIRTIVNSNQSPYTNAAITYQFTQLGIYVIRFSITDRRGCTRTSATDTVIIQGPDPNFTALPLTTCDTAFTVQFKDSSVTNAGIPITQWQWNFGDGSNDVITTDNAILKYYRNPFLIIPVKTFSVRLIVTDSVGCTNSINKNNYIRMYKPKANFYSNDTMHCNQRSAFLINTSQAVNGGYSWYLGNDTVRYTTNVSYTYAADGEYNIKLVVKDENGCMDSLTKLSYIKFVHPIANMRIRDTGQCWPVQIRFDDSSKYAKAVEWNFGDGSPKQYIINPKKNYSVPGTYTITLVVTGPDGCKDTTAKIIKVKGAQGELKEGPVTGCKPFTATMRVINKVNIDSFAWDWNDGSVVLPVKDDSTGIHIYPEAGQYLPNVIIISSEGCRYSLRGRNTIIVDSAKALFTAIQLNFCTNDTLRVNNLSTVPNFSQIIKYGWLWGDGQTSAVAQPQYHVYSTDGVFPIRLAIESKYGCIDTFDLPQPVKIFSPPKIIITGQDSACQHSILRFNASIQSSDSITATQWVLNGSNAGTDSTINLRFDTVGVYALSYKISTRYSCDTVVTKRIIILPTPNPQAAPDTTICIGSGFSLRAFEGNSYMWQPQATPISSNTFLPIVPPSPGITKYIVTVTNAVGCVTKDTVTIRVDDSVYLRTISPVEVCAGKMVTLKAQGTTNNFLWMPATALSNNTIANPVAWLNDTTVYTVIGYSNNICPNDTGKVQVNVNPIPQINAVANKPETTPGNEVMLAAKGTGNIATYNWMPASTLSNTVRDTTTWLYPDTSTTFTVRVISNAGCINDASVRVIVKCSNNAVVVPSAFTPRGKNPYFKPGGLFKSDPEIKSFTIFNRWGEVVYQEKNKRVSQMTGWDGIFKGVLQSRAVFVWLLELECKEGIDVKKGTVALIN